MFDFVVEFVSDLDLFGVEKMKRVREYDEAIFSRFADLSAGEKNDCICNEVTGDATYFASQLADMVEITEFINDEENTFWVDEIEVAFNEYGESVEELINFLPSVSSPHHYQEGDGDTKYTFNYKRWDSECQNFEQASRTMQENMTEALRICGEMKDSYSTFRSLIAKLLQK